jgi:secondary thiamine-phosphate synthase enzyme
MRVHQERLTVSTPGAGLHDITADIARVVSDSGVTTGLVTVFVQHTSASLIIQENASPDVRTDLSAWMSELAPESRRWRHDEEGPDDMPAHARAAITRTSETIPITAGRLALGTWQALYLWEHRQRPHARSLVVHVQGL